MVKFCDAKVQSEVDYQLSVPRTAQKMKFFIKDFFSKCDQIRRGTYAAFGHELFLQIGLL